MFISNPLLADGFDFFGKHGDLKMTVIVDVGDAEKISAPYGKYPTKDTIKLAGRCFEPYYPYLGIWGVSKAALLLVDQNKNIKIALLENSLNSIKVEIISVAQIDCDTRK
jgi:hypothetical protein